MSTKTKKLSQLLFRRSSTNTGSAKPQFMGGGNSNKHSKEDSDLSPLLIPQIVETTPKLVSHVIFADKPLKTRRSYSPSKTDPDTKPVSILKNGQAPRGRPAGSKATLQRTKSTPNPSTNGANPLQEVSWNCPTLEKRKEMILNYFKNIVIDNGVLINNKDDQNLQCSEMSEPIYEEIQDQNPEFTKYQNFNNNNNKANMDSLKPKITPKKFRAKNPHNQSNNLENEDNDNKPPPIYDKLLTRSSSFNVYEDIQTIRGNKEKYLVKSKSQNGTNDVNIYQDKNTVGLAHFASQVAQHAKANRSSSFSLSSKTLSESSSSSYSTSSTSSSESSSSASSRNFDSYDFDVDMDQIYSKIDKRVKKVGTPMSRLLKRHPNPIQVIPNQNPQYQHHRYQNIPNHDGPNSDHPNELNLLLAPQSKSNTNDTTNTTKFNSSDCFEEQLKKVQSALKEQIKPCSPISPRTINTFAPGGGNDSSTEEGSLMIEVPLLTSNSSSCYSSESESLVHQNQNHSYHIHKLQQPVRPPRGNRQSASVYITVPLPPEESPLSSEATVKNKHIKSNNNLLENGEKVGKVLLEKDLSANLSFTDDNNNSKNTLKSKETGLLDLAEIFPPFGNSINSCQNSIAIDSTESSPRSYPVENKKLLKGNEDIVIVHLVPKLQPPPRPAPPNLGNFMEFNNKNNSGTDAHLLGENYQSSHNHNNTTTEMSNSTEEVEVGQPSPNLLIETKESISIDKFFWESSHSPSQKSEGGSSTTSDLSDTSSSSSSPETTMSNSVTTMDFNNANMNSNSNKRESNPFIRQESKFYEDVDEDGGFESFQVADDSNYEDEGTDDHLSSGTPQSASPDSGLAVANRERTFAQSQQNIPENELKLKASSVLDLINAEISDLHMREMELKHKTQMAEGKEDFEMAEGSSQADSDDYSDSAVDIGSYSPTSNSPGNLTPADSRNRGGSPYSPNLDHDSTGDKLDDFVDVTDGHGGSGRSTGHALDVNNSSKTTSAMITEDESESLISNNKQQQGVKVRPIVEEEVKSIELNMTKETPIELEIRLVREREDEFRRHRIPSSTTTAPTAIDKDEQLQAEKTEVLTTSSPQSPNAMGHPSIVPKGVKSVEITASVEETKPTLQSPPGTVSFGGPGSPKDIQYEMATARLKREIEESLMRERELYREGRLKTISVSDSIDETEPKEKLQIQELEVESSDETPSSPNSEEKSVEDHNILPSAGRKALTKLSLSTQSPAKKDEIKTSTPSSGSHGVRFFTPTAYASNSNGAHIISPVISPITTPVSPSFPTSEVIRRASLTSSSSPVNNSIALGSSQHHQTHSLPMNIAKPQFTSIERMILKGSFSFNKNSMPQESNNMMHHEEQSRMSKTSRTPDPLQIVHRTESIEETEEGAAVEVVKPRRKYVPAQDKIQLELQEQNKRETELSQLRAKWKSTPDLSKSSEEQSENCIDSEEVVVERSQEAESLTKPSYLRRQRSSSTQKLNGAPEEVSTSDVLRMNKPTVRRRQSALINQWEEMIKQQQEKNKN